MQCMINTGLVDCVWMWRYCTDKQCWVTLISLPGCKPINAVQWQVSTSVLELTLSKVRQKRQRMPKRQEVWMFIPKNKSFIKCTGITSPVKISWLQNSEYLKFTDSVEILIFTVVQSTAFNGRSMVFLVYCCQSAAYTCFFIILFREKIILWLLYLPQIWDIHMEEIGTW